MQSFAKAIELGCHRAELDIHVSMDNVAVVIHDASVERTTNGNGLVENLTLVQLQSLDAGGGQRIPTLREVMDLCRHKISLQIELKAKNSPPLVAALVREAWAMDDLVITSFDLALLTQCAALLPAVPLGLLNREPHLDMIATAEKHGHRWICPRFDIATQDLVIKAHGKRLSVYVYHVNKPEIAQNLAGWGVDAIGTDFPDLLQRAL